MALLRQFLRIQKPQAARYGIRFRVLGDLSGLDQGLLHDLHRSMAETASFTAMTLNIALNYSGRRDILNAVERIRCHPPQHPLSETDFGRYLSTEGQNDPDLIIRTSGEQRLSNFLLWELAYAEILFLETLWPDFSMDDFFTAVENFQARTRRFGGL
jgi:undecaprenyl diphosphate synthase